MDIEPKSLLNTITRDVAFLSRDLWDYQIFSDYFYDTLMELIQRIKKKYSDDKEFINATKKLIEQRLKAPKTSINILDIQAIQQSIQLLDTCIQSGQRGESNTYINLKLMYSYHNEDMYDKEIADNGYRNYQTIIKDILENVSKYARQCVNSDGKSDVQQITKLIKQLKECVTMSEKINETNIHIINKLKFESGTMNLRELARDVAKKNNLQPYDLASEFELETDVEPHRGGKRRTRRNKSLRSKRTHRKKYPLRQK